MHMNVLFLSFLVVVFYLKSFISDKTCVNFFLAQLIMTVSILKESGCIQLMPTKFALCCILHLWVIKLDVPFFLFVSGCNCVVFEFGAPAEGSSPMHMVLCAVQGC